MTVRIMQINPRIAFGPWRDRRESEVVKRMGETRSTKTFATTKTTVKFQIKSDNGSDLNDCIEKWPEIDNTLR